VAPAPIENLINVHPMIELSMVSGVGQVAAVAVVVLAEARAPAAAGRVRSAPRSRPR
jgi:long-chain acyl-CoA synthetase